MNELTTNTAQMNHSVLPFGLEEYEIKIKKLDYESKLMEYDLRLAEKLSESAMVPKNFQGKPNDVFAAIQYGRSLGMEVMLALRAIKLITGMHGLDAQGMIAVILASRKADSAPDLKHERDANGRSVACTCTWHRNGKPVSKRFSLEDAKKAGLLGNTGWKNYEENMLEWRSIAFASRLGFADVLSGIYSIDELDDMKEIKEINPHSKNENTSSPPADDRSPEKTGLLKK